MNAVENCSPTGGAEKRSAFRRVLTHFRFRRGNHRSAKCCTPVPPYPSPNLSALLAALFCLVFALPAWATDVQVRASRNQVSIDESFDLVFQAEGALNGEPDFSPLEEQFEILSQHQSQNIQMINSQIRRSVSWTLTLMAKETGDLEVPAIRFGNDRSHPLIIQVHAGAPQANGNGGEDIYLDLRVEPEQPYVQGQILVTVRLYVSDKLSDVRVRELGEPELKGVDAVVEHLGEDRQFRTKKGTRSYRVLERRYALFPQQSGSASLEPIRFEGEVGIAGRAFSLFDRRGLGSSGPRILRDYSERRQIQIQPAPPGTQVQPWLPAQQLTLEEAWSTSPEQLELGQPLTRTLALIADGLTAAQLPPLAQQDLPDGLKAYPDQPLLQNQAGDDGVIGSRQEKIAIVATRPGDYTLPAIDIAWWDTENHEARRARLPERDIRVVAPAGLASPPPAAPAETPAADVPTETGPTTPTGWAARWLGPITDSRLAWLSLGLALGWFATLLAWWRSARRRSARTSLNRTDKDAAPDLGAALKRVRTSYRARNPVAAREALLQWGRARWPQDPPPHLEAVARRCGDPVRDAIDALNRDCYTPRGGDNWHRLPMDKYLEQLGREDASPSSHDPTGLLPELRPS